MPENFKRRKAKKHWPIGQIVCVRRIHPDFVRCKGCIPLNNKIDCAIDCVKPDTYKGSKHQPIYPIYYRTSHENKTWDEKMMNEPNMMNSTLKGPKTITTGNTNMSNYVLEYMDHSNVRNLEKLMMTRTLPMTDL